MRLQQEPQEYIKCRQFYSASSEEVMGSRTQVIRQKFAFPLQCVWIKLNGSWPITPRFAVLQNLYVLWSWFIIIIVGITIYYQAAYLVYSFGDILKVTENCSTTFMGFQNFIRLIHLRLHQKDFRKLINDFKEHIWFESGTDRKIEERCKKEMIIFRAMSVMLFSLICMYCVLPMIELLTNPNSTEKPFPYKMIFPYNPNNGIIYILTYIMTAYAGFAVVTTLFAEDSLFGFFITYVCAQFRLLHKSIQNIIPGGYENAVRKYGENTPEKLIQAEYFRLLKIIAKKHAILIRFCDQVENFFSPILLVNFTISSILICVVGFQIVTGKMSIGDYAKLTLYILSALTQLFILCWNGNNIIQRSTETSWALYSCNWEGGFFEKPNENFESKYAKRIHYPPGGSDFKKGLSFMIMRSQKPVKITALKFSVLSLQSFTTILSTSMSYFTLLQTLFEE